MQSQIFWVPRRVGNVCLRSHTQRLFSRRHTDTDDLSNIHDAVQVMIRANPVEAPLVNHTMYTRRLHGALPFRRRTQQVTIHNPTCIVPCLIVQTDRDPTTTFVRRMVSSPSVVQDCGTTYPRADDSSSVRRRPGSMRREEMGTRRARPLGMRLAGILGNRINSFPTPKIKHCYSPGTLYIRDGRISNACMHSYPPPPSMPPRTQSNGNMSCSYDALATNRLLSLRIKPNRRWGYRVRQTLMRNVASYCR